MGTFKDITGRRFGRLVAVRRAENSVSGKVMWHCICDCGGTTISASGNLMNGGSTSCGCKKAEAASSRGFDLIGERFSRLLVVAFISTEGIHRKWECLCDCGRAALVSTARLRRNVTRSCGCLQRDTRITHGMTKTRTYATWLSMRSRCNDPRYDGYYGYGAIGITVCERWTHSFENFLEDMGERPKGKTLDRIDGALGYTKENCRWATPKEQADNRGTTRFLTHNGETLPLKDWAKRLGITDTSLRLRISRGWAMGRALSHGDTRRKHHAPPLTTDKKC